MCQFHKKLRLRYECVSFIKNVRERAYANENCIKISDKRAKKRKVVKVYEFNGRKKPAAHSLIPIYVASSNEWHLC